MLTGIANCKLRIFNLHLQSFQGVRLLEFATSIDSIRGPFLTRARGAFRSRHEVLLVMIRNAGLNYSC